MDVDHWALSDETLPGGGFVRYGTFGDPGRLCCRLRGAVHTRTLTRLWSQVFQLHPRPDVLVVDLRDAEVELTVAGAAAVMRMARSLSARGTRVLILGAPATLEPFRGGVDDDAIRLVADVPVA